MNKMNDDSPEDALRESEKKYRNIVESINEGVWVIDKDANTTYVNPRLTEMLGYTKEEMADRALFSFMDENDLEYVKNHLETRKKGVKEQYDLDLIRKDGSKIHTLAQASPIYDDKGIFVGSMAGITDITIRKKAEAEVAKLKQRIEFILGATKTGIDIIDSDFNLIYVDPEWQKIYGDFKGRKCYEYFKGAKMKCPNCGMLKALETNKPVVTEDVLPKEDNRPIQVNSIPFIDDNGECLVAEVNIDISERKRNEEELTKLATLDPLTEIVLNRRFGLIHLERQMQLSKRENSKLCVCYVDMDGLKKINDDYGHKEGDEVLTYVAESIKGALREIDIVARMGGDEFLIAFPGCTIKQANDIWDRVIVKLSEFSSARKKPYSITVSKGFAQYNPKDDTSLSQLIVNADNEMYKNKKSKVR